MAQISIFRREMIFKNLPDSPVGPQLARTDSQVVKVEKIQAKITHSLHVYAVP